MSAAPKSTTLHAQGTIVMHRTQLKNSQREIVLLCFAKGKSPCRHCWFSIPDALLYDERQAVTPSFLKNILNVGAVAPHQFKAGIAALKRNGMLRAGTFVRVTMAAKNVSTVIGRIAADPDCRCATPGLLKQSPLPARHT